MFESYFGLSGPPFQLGPDPAFYFDSRGHGHALAYLKFGAHQGEGFVVVTGEIGAGKTLLVRTLLEGLDKSKVVAAHVVSTQLEAGDLLRAIMGAFGIAATGGTKAHHLASIEAFFVALAIKGRRALLVVDEAQNLGREAVEELRMLSNFQLGSTSLLQSFLVGQPELRTLLQSKSMEQLRQRVTASCHLGPMDSSETRAYIEHRLRHVGWKGRPHFDEEAFGEIHRLTGGIPRKINRLCNRLLLGAFLSEQDRIPLEGVLRIGAELNGEIGEFAANGSAEAERPTAVAVDGSTARDFELVQHGDGQVDAPLVCLVDTPLDYLKAAVLARVLGRGPRALPVVIVHPGRLEALGLGMLTGDEIPRAHQDIHLNAGIGDPALGIPKALLAFESVLKLCKPAAVLAFGSGDAALACAQLAVRRGIPLMREDAGRHRSWPAVHLDINSALMDQLADLLFTEDLVSNHALFRAGIDSARVHCVGSFAPEALDAIQAAVPALGDLLARIRPSIGTPPSRQPFVIAAMSREMLAKDLEDVVATLKALARLIPVMWLLDEASSMRLHREQGVAEALRAASVCVVPSLPYADVLGLFRGAACLVTDAVGPYLAEAELLAVPGYLVGPDGFSAVRGGGAGQDADSQARSAAELVAEVTGERKVPQRRVAPEAGAPARVAAHVADWIAGSSPDGRRAQPPRRQSTPPKIGK
jgi:putative secretion ATPase (PEP-CTERM system associated)